MNNSKYLDKSDEDLLLLFSNSNDRVALEALFNRHMASAYYLALKFMRNEADAEDVVQKSFINVMRFAKNQNQPGKVKAWIMKTVVNTSKSEIQNLITHRKHIQKKSEIHNNKIHELQLDSEELRKILVSAIEKLPEHFRLPIWLTHYEEMSIKEVADCLGKPEKTIRTQIARGLEKLENSLKGQLSNINTMVIIGVLAESKLKDQPPFTLIERVKSISRMKISNRITSQSKSQHFHFSNFIIYFSIIVLVGSISYIFLKKNTIISKHQVLLESSKVSTLNVKRNLENDKLDLYTDFNNKIMPIWCNIEKGEKEFFTNNDNHSYFLNSDKSDFFLLKLEIPPQNKPFIVSYDMYSSRGNEFFNRIHSISGGNKKDTVTFCYDTPLKLNNWNHIEIVAQDNIESMWFNGVLKMVVVSKKAYEYPYQIECTNFKANIDNIKVKSCEPIKVPDLGKFIELANDIDKKEKPISIQVQSPIKHPFNIVNVYSLTTNIEAQ